MHTFDATDDVAMCDGDSLAASTAGNLIKTAADVGSAQYVSKFSAAFDLEGLFSASDKAVLDGGDDDDGDDNKMETEDR